MKKAEASPETGNSVLPFPQALRELMAVRKVSYRKLATRTKLSAGYLNHIACGTRAIPGDSVIRTIARALKVKPEYFLEYRQRGLEKALYKSPELTDYLYDFVVADKPLPRDFKSVLENARK